MAFNMKGPTFYKEAWSGRNKAGNSLGKAPAPKKIKALDILTGGLSRVFGKKKGAGKDSAAKKLSLKNILMPHTLLKKKSGGKLRSDSAAKKLTLGKILDPIGIFRKKGKK